MDSWCRMDGGSGRSGGGHPAYTHRFHTFRGGRSVKNIMLYLEIIRFRAILAAT